MTLKSENDSEICGIYFQAVLCGPGLTRCFTITLSISVIPTSSQCASEYLTQLEEQNKNEVLYLMSHLFTKVSNECHM